MKEIINKLVEIVVISLVAAVLSALICTAIGL